MHHNWRRCHQSSGPSHLVQTPDTSKSNWQDNQHQSRLLSHKMPDQDFILYLAMNPSPLSPSLRHFPGKMTPPSVFLRPLLRWGVEEVTFQTVGFDIKNWSVHDAGDPWSSLDQFLFHSQCYRKPQLDSPQKSQTLTFMARTSSALFLPFSVITVLVQWDTNIYSSPRSHKYLNLICPVMKRSYQQCPSLPGI